MLRTRHRAWLALLVLLSTVAAVGCGSAAPEWQEATTASGNYTAEFPGKPTTRTQAVPGSDLSIQFTEFESGKNSFAISETALNGITPYPLDEAVDGSIESARAGEESSSGRTVTATDISRTTGDFEGVETRRYSVNLVGGDANWTIDGLIFYRDDAIVAPTVVSKGASDPESVDRFLSSLTARTG